ncbi:hypothetical protein Q9L58_010192 [Maublancomyces gigas]|uniref:Uncharacterized protein n=1 Tax=Discina gigas TaxID=1032678 RepID=A0ABR3G4T0_9PEZI
MSSISSETITIPERVTGKLPIAYWEIYFTILTDRLAQDFPGYEETERAGIAMGSLQFIACGNAALDSLAEFRKKLEKRGYTSEAARKTSKGRKVKDLLNRIRKNIFDF